MKKIRLLALLLALLMLPIGMLFSCQPKDGPEDDPDVGNNETPEDPGTEDVVMDNDGTRSGYLVYFNFDAAARGNLPDKAPYTTYLNLPVKEGGSYVVDKKFGSTTDGTLLVYRKDSSTDPYVEVKVENVLAADLESEHMLQFKVRFEDGLFGTEAKVYGRKGGSKSVTQEFLVIGNGYIKDCAGNTVYGDDPADKRGWITVSLMINDQKGVYDIFIDGIKKTNSLAYTNSGYPLWGSELPGCYRLSLSSSTDAETFFYIDDLCMMNGNEETTGVYVGEDISYIDTYSRYVDILKLDRNSVIALYNDTLRGKMKNDVFSSSLLMSNVLCLSKVVTSVDTSGNVSYSIVDLQKDLGVEEDKYSSISILYKDNAYFSVGVEGDITFDPDKTVDGGEFTGKWKMDGTVITFTWDGGTAPKIGESDIKTGTYAESVLKLFSDDKATVAIDGAEFALFVPDAYDSVTYISADGQQTVSFDTFLQTVSLSIKNGETPVMGEFAYTVAENNITFATDPAITFVYDAVSDSFTYGEVEFTKLPERLPEDEVGENENLGLKFTNFGTGATSISFPIDNEWWQEYSDINTMMEFTFYADKKMVNDGFRFMLLFDCGTSISEPGKAAYYQIYFDIDSDSVYKEGWNTFTFDVKALSISRDADLKNLKAIAINTTGWSNGIKDGVKPDGKDNYDVGDDGYTMVLGKLSFVETSFVPMEGPSEEHRDCTHVDDNGNDLFVAVEEMMPSNCLLGSYYIKRCSVCGATKLDKDKPIGEPTGHDLTDVEYYQPPTCAEEGYYYKKCATCGENVVQGEMIPATGHKFYETVDWSTRIKTMTCQFCGYSETSVLFDKLLSFSEKMSYLGLTHESKQVGYVDATVHPDLSIGDFGINASGPSYNKTNLIEVVAKFSTFKAVQVKGQYAFEYTRGPLSLPEDPHFNININDAMPAGTNFVIEFEIMPGAKTSDGKFATIASSFKDRTAIKKDVGQFNISDTGLLTVGSNSELTIQLSETKFTNIAICYNVDSNEMVFYADGVLVGSAPLAASVEESMAFRANDFRFSFNRNKNNEANASYYFNNIMYYTGDSPICVLSSTDVKEEYTGDITLQDELNDDMKFPFEVGYVDVDAKLPAAIYTSQYIMQFRINGKDLADGVLIEGYKLKNGVNYYQALLEIKDGKLYCMGVLVSESTENFLVTFIANDRNGTVSVMINGELIPGGPIDYASDLYADNTAAFRGLIFRNDCGKYTVSDFEMYTGNTLKTAE